MAQQTNQKTQEKKNENIVARAGKWLWRNKWSLIGAFATGAAAGFAGDRLVQNLGNKDKAGNGPTEL